MNDTKVLDGFVALEEMRLKDSFNIFHDIIKGENGPTRKYEALIGLALTHRGLGDVDESIDLLNKAVELIDDPIEAYYDLGNLYEEIGDHMMAIQYFDKALSIDSDHMESYLNRGVSWYNMDEIDSAIKDFKNAQKLSKYSTLSITNKGICYLDMSRYEKAIDVFDRTLEMDHRNIHALLGKGLALYNMDRYDESIICFDAALSINPGFYIAHYFKGTILKKLDLPKEAIEAFNKAVEVKNDYSPAWFELGEIMAQSGDQDGALDAYEKSIESSRVFFEEAMFKKGKLLLDMEHDISGAIKVFKTICKRNPYVPKVWYELGRALSMSKGKTKKSIDALQNVLNLDPDNSEAIKILAIQYIEVGKEDKALNLLKKGMMKNPSSENQLLISDIHMDMGQPKKAILAAEEALSIDPLNSHAWLIMGRAYGKINRIEEYKQCLRKYLNSNPNDVEVQEELEGL